MPEVELELFETAPPAFVTADVVQALPRRLRQLGLAPGTPVTLTRNRSVMLSWRARSGLRLHAGFAAAPDDVLQAIVRYLARWVPRAERARARRIFMALPVHHHVEPRRVRPRLRPPIAAADQPIVDRLVHIHALLNARHFDGTLATVPIFLSDRMRRRLGELRVPRDGAPPEIVISRRHLRRDGWEAAVDTLLHEMIHQWQVESGAPLGHGRLFRQKALAVGISPRAIVDL